LKAREALYNFNSQYFLDILPQSENWRLYEFFKDEAVFLDIETTGLNFEDSLYFLCGPAEFVKASITSLEEIGVTKEQIKTDVWG